MNRDLFVNDVSKHINENSAALFMGAGISASTGLPSWLEILKPLAYKLGVTISPETDLYQIAQFYNNRFKRNEIIREYEKQIDVITKESDYLNSAIDLGFREIWTTNYDRVIEQCLQRRKITPKVVNSDHNLNNITNEGVHIYKMNGDITNPEDMVITKSDLEKYPVSHELMLTFLKKELVSKSFLFLGYSFSDSLILSILASIRNCLGESCTVHYTILEKNSASEFFIEDLYERYNIQALLIDSREEFPVVLKEIKEKCTEKRVFISGSFDSLPITDDEFADQLCVNLVEQLYSKEYTIASGMGRKIGNYLSGHAYEYLYTTNPYDMGKKLLMWPFYEKMNSIGKSKHRNEMISNCNMCVFMFGKSLMPDGSSAISKGVLEEFDIAKRLNKAIIPLPTTQYAAEVIFQNIKENIILFPYLEPYISVLSSSRDPKELASIVVRICDDYLSWQHRAP